MRGSIRIGRIAGIPIGLNPSWFVALFLIVGLLGLQIYPDLLPDREGYVHWTLAAVSAAFFFVSILLHELAHSLLARRFGVPVKGITLFIFGGVSQITRDAERPLHEFVFALVGPLSSLAIAGVCFGGWAAGGFAEDAPAPIVVEWLFVMNMALGLFNLVPAFPMDGGRVLRAALWGVTGNFMRATRLASLTGRGIAYALMTAGLLSFLQFDWWPLNGVIDQFSGLWFMLIGFFLETSARTSYAQVRVLEALRGQTVGDAMSRDIATVGRGISIEDVVTAYMAGEGRASLFVTDENGAVVGVVTPREVRGIPRARWPQVKAGEVMLASERVPVTDSRSDIASTLQRMEGEDLFQLPVIDDGRLIGIVDRIHILQLIQRVRARQA